MSSSHHPLFAGALVAGLLAGAPLASAQPAPASDAAPLPGFATLDRVDGQTKVSAYFAYLFFDDDGLLGGDLSGQRVDLHVQYVHPELALGAYGVLGYGRVSNNDDSESSLANLEIGGLYEIRGPLPIVLRGGLVLPTADEEEFAPILSSFARLTDFYVNAPDTTLLRLSASPLVRRGQFVFRADAGLDIPIDQPSDEVLGDDLDPLARLSVGGGIDTGQVAVLGELVNVATLDDVEDEADRYIHSIAATGRYTGSDVVQPGLSAMVPLDDDLGDFLEFALIVTADFPIATGGGAGAPPPPR